MKRRFLLGLVPFASVLAWAEASWAQSPPAAPETIAVGDWQLAPQLELRTRGEYYRDPVDMGGGIDAAGSPGPNVRNAGGILERSRLGLGAERGAIKAQLTIQDARVFGIVAPTGTLGGSDFGLAQIAPLEAYVDVHTSGTRASFVRFGRQLVTWGDGRLIGAADWSPTARPLDSVRAHLATGNFDFEVLGVMLDTTRPLGTGFGDAAGPSRGGSQLYAGQAGWAIAPLLKVQLFAFARIARSGGAIDPTRGFSSARNEGETYTGALRVSGDSRGFRYGVEGAYQIGNAPNVNVSAPLGGGGDREAYAAAAYVEKTLDRLALTPTLRIGGAYASGDDGSGKYKQFDPLLPDVHAWHGLMNVFAWSNEIEGNARATIAPWSDTTFALEYRYAMLADKGGEWVNAYLASVGRQLANGTPRSASAELGHEIDAVCTWTPWTPLELMLGYSALLEGDGARTILAAEARGSVQPNGTYSPVGVAHYGYLQATLRVP